MNYRTRLTLAAIGVLVMTDIAAAQNDVTFVMPLNLSDLSPEIYAVQVNCRIRSDAIPGGDYGTSDGFPVVNRRVATTATLRVRLSALNNPAGKTATYVCTLLGRREPIEAEWRLFSANASDPAFRLTPTPDPIIGTFNWVELPSFEIVPSGNATTTSPRPSK